MVKCDPECPVCCDHCKHFDFNGEPFTGTDGSVVMVDVGKGHCRLYNRPEDPGSGCDDFHCKRAK